jgi:hypothetical protein
MRLRKTWRWRCLPVSSTAYECSVVRAVYFCLFHHTCTHVTIAHRQTISYRVCCCCSLVRFTNRVASIPTLQYRFSLSCLYTQQCICLEQHVIHVWRCPRPSRTRQPLTVLALCHAKCRKLSQDCRLCVWMVFEHCNCCPCFLSLSEPLLVVKEPLTETEQRVAHAATLGICVGFMCVTCGTVLRWLSICVACALHCLLCWYSVSWCFLSLSVAQHGVAVHSITPVLCVKHSLCAVATE